MRKIVLSIVLITVFGCAQKVDTKDLHFLNGYWEIKEVRFLDGATKTYEVNPMVEYIKLDSLQGYRKKVNPKFDGTYTATDDAELFTVLVKEDKLILMYKNSMSEWTEELQTLSKTQFSIRNAEGFTYTYQRFTPINSKE